MWRIHFIEGSRIINIYHTHPISLNVESTIKKIQTPLYIDLINILF